MNATKRFSGQTFPGSGGTLTEAVQAAFKKARVKGAKRVQVIYIEYSEASPGTFNVIVRIPEH